MAGNFFRSFLFVVSCMACAMVPLSAPAQSAFATTSGGQLVRFDLSAPGTLLASATITGLQAGESILGIDFRTTGQLYALGSTSRLYVVNFATGVATQVGSSGAFTLNGTSFGFDFNPTVDLIRVVTNNDQNMRLNPNTGALTANDVALNYVDANAGTNPNVVGSAYANNVPGAVTTTLYGIDSNLDVLVIQNPPNGGALTVVGPLGVNATAVAGFDISSSSGVETGYAALQVGAVSNLYTINLSTGAATLIGGFPGGTTITGLAVLPGFSGTLVTQYRLYNPGTLEHLYTTDLNEYNTLSARGWQPEGAIYRIFSGAGSYGGMSTVAYYRLYNPSSYQHHWTTFLQEYNVLATVGWQQEGIAGYLPSNVTGTVPLYRLYLNAQGGLHLWTTDVNERNYLIANAGWTDEGIAGYVVPLP